MVNGKLTAPKKKRGGQPGNKGGGRKPGSSHKVNQEIKKECLASGMTPLQFACAVINTDVGAKINNHVVTWEDIKWAMSVSLPKLHADAQPPKQGSLGTIQVMFDPQKFAKMSLDEIRQTREQLVRLQSGVDPSGPSDGQVTRLDPFASPGNNRVN